MNPWPPLTPYPTTLTNIESSFTFHQAYKLYKQAHNHSQYHAEQRSENDMKKMQDTLLKAVFKPMTAPVNM